MLADLVVQFPKSDFCRLLPEVQQIGHVAMAEKAAVAQRFNLRRDAVMMLHTISETSPKRFLQALGVCRLPFPVMWVEFPYADRQAWVDSVRSRGNEIVSRANASPPKHLGFLLEQEDDEGRVVLVHPMWTHTGHEASLCYKSLRIDTRPEFRASTEMVANIRRGLQASIEARSPDTTLFARHVRRSAEEFDAGVELQARIDYMVPDHLKPLWFEMARRNPAGVREMDDMALFDLRSEWRFVLALLTTLNSRNVIDYGPVEEYTKLNKSRVKSGKPALLTHREIRLSLSRVQKRRILMSGVGEHDIQASLVMGHYKVRKSGVFWWSPHVRGAGELEGTRTYNVTA